MCDADDQRLNYQQMLTEISSVLETTAESSDANALKLNQELQRRLEQVRTSMLELLKQVRARYARNEEILIRRLKPRTRYSVLGSGSVSENIGQSGAVLRGGTFRFKGNLYFRDVDGRSCPNNEDYNSRCATEMFPTDFDMRSKHVWTVLDKKNVVMGIKQQLLDHITEQSKTEPTISKPKKRKAIDLHEQTLASLLNSADSSFSIDWNQISTLDVELRHSSYSCEAMWLVYLHPQLKRDDWTNEEDEKLVDAARANKLQNWKAIAAAVHQRSEYQCFVRMQTTLRFNLEPASNFKWSELDNERLRNIVSQNTVNGVINWSEVVEHFPGRSRSTLIGRYMYVLHPSISHEPFTPKEDLMLFSAFEQYNGKFNCFPRTLFPNRSLAQLRTRYHNVLAQRNKTDSWSVEDDSKLIEFVSKHGTSQWVNCANHLGNHTRTSCRTRFLVINRFVEQHPNAQISDIPRRKTNKKAQVTADNWTQRLEEFNEDPDSLLSMDVTQQNPKPKKIKQEALSYADTLRGWDLRIYDYFKFAYNLNLRSAPTPVPLPRDARNFYAVANALSFRPPATGNRLIESFSLCRQLSRCYNKMLCQLPPPPNDMKATPTDQLLPPNWSTMMGFRSICIWHCCNQATSVQSTFNYDESHPAVQLFRQRLRTLFYRTILLSRLETTEFAQLPEALMQQPRPVPNCALPETGKCVNPTSHRQPKKQLKLQKSKVISGLRAQETAHRQIQDLERMTSVRHSLKSEPNDSHDVLNVKQELSFD
ncbi:uncharacterized protein LOC117792384 [Drosophila innubila]|uniref:uncharacterized protein LOC117792384 n=1 Tax=Drosophila innubila TaxID=198719 RepID=UPI00148E03FC|nr:uncharacterized protein LOC117792384 [Drosophila innubila]